MTHRLAVWRFCCISSTSWCVLVTRAANNEIVEARDAGRAYLRDQLLNRWTVNDIWGRNYWDWVDNVQAENVTEFAARYLMDNPDVFPNWRADARNILTLFLNHTSVCPVSAGEVYSGAWAFPESAGCCGRSLWYGPMEMAVPLAQYGRTGRQCLGAGTGPPHTDSGHVRRPRNGRVGRQH